ncbi:putative membrane protein YphA (DoxX/SURF4 family) [Paenibacillus phyllosphaerae]|uniref:Putative membrane protein YphA (DoxX/SURF4 family) n=1 Tax=Paenibacillus phyllosphaerae TaxID=274593 RepID=A0A7W5FM15_9BACL|nr:DoxX family protein [Paenibacillus phyllosphaerae]MBB3109648.1 putative membrane protein YphA (DoxX/SURF4 family) [Paenibacillus phyllosphaerae]
MHILAIVLQSWLLFSMAFFGGSKIAGAKHQIELFESIQLPQWFRLITGYLQALGAIGLVIGYWDAGFAAWSAIGIGIMMLVAIVTHLRVKHSLGKTFPAILNLLIALAVVLLYADELSAVFG